MCSVVCRLIVSTLAPFPKCFRIVSLFESSVCINVRIVKIAILIGTIFEDRIDICCILIRKINVYDILYNLNYFSWPHKQHLLSCILTQTEVNAHLFQS